MTPRTHGVRARFAGPSWLRHPVAVPVGCALLAVGLLCTVGWVAAREANRAIQSDAQARVRSNRDAAVRALVRQTNDFKATVAASAANKPVIDSLRAPTPVSLRSVQDQMSTLARSKVSPSAFVTDTQGRIMTLYPWQPELVGASFAFRDWVKGVSRTGEPYVSEAFRTAATGHPLVVAVAAPVVDGTRQVGIVIVLWQLESVRQLSLGTRADDGVSITVTDQKGQPLTGNPVVDDRGQTLQIPVSNATREALAGRSTNTVVGRTLQASGPVPGLGWTVTASMPSAVALTPAQSFQRSLSITLGVAILLVLAFTGLTWHGARRRRAEQTQAARHARTLIEASLDPIATISPEGKITDVNQATVRATGISRDELIETDFSHYFTEPDRANEGYIQAFAKGSITDYPLTMRHRDQTLTEVLYNASVYRDAKGSVLGVFAAARDMTAQKQAAANARSMVAAEDLVRTVLASASIGIALAGPDGSFRLVNPALCDMTGYDEAWFMAHRVRDIVHPDDLEEVLRDRARVLTGSLDTSTVTQRLARADGATLWVRRVSVLIAGGEDQDMIMVQLEDITAEHEAHETLEYRAFHDSMTGLHNRAWILDILEVDLRAAERLGTSVAVLFVDLDNFKVVNDSLGHSAGDEVLAAVADRVVEVVRPGDRVGRFGGDEFVIVVQDVQDALDAERCAERLSASIAADLQVRGHRIVPKASIGIALSTSTSTPDSLLRDADSALSRAKSAGRARWQFFDGAMHAQAVARLTIEDQLRDAITQGEFVVHYQPIVALADATVVGHEALVRWMHPTRGLIGPGDFLDIAEDTGLITAIGAQVLDQVCALLEERPDLPGAISVNVSAVQLASRDWLAEVRDTLRRHRVDPARIVIEVTETAVLSLVDSARTALTSLRELGVGIHVDDFGTGYSSISVLQDLPVTGVKLDLRFVHGLTADDSQANALAHGLSGLVDGMQLTGIAEGVETLMQADILREQGWPCAQGYYFGRPAARPVTNSSSIGNLIHLRQSRRPG